MAKKEIVVRLSFDEQKTSIIDIENALNELARKGVRVEVIDYSRFAERVNKLLATMAPYAIEAS